MLSLVTDYQWNRKHIFLKSLTLISKLFPYWNKTDPRSQVKTGFFFSFSFFSLRVRIKVQLGDLFFSRPPVRADKQKYLCSPPRAVTWQKTFKTKAKTELSNGVFSWPVLGRTVKEMNKSQFELLTHQWCTTQPSQWSASHNWKRIKGRWCFRE